MKKGIQEKKVLTNKNEIHSIHSKRISKHYKIEQGKKVISNFRNKELRVLTLPFSSKSLIPISQVDATKMSRIFEFIFENSIIDVQDFDI